MSAENWLNSKKIAKESDEFRKIMRKQIETMAGKSVRIKKILVRNFEFEKKNAEKLVRILKMLKRALKILKTRKKSCQN